MQPEQNAHLGRIKDWIKSRLDAKYTAGQAEHGGNLWERKTINDMEGEIVDLCTYYFCVREDFERVHQTIVQMRSAFSQGDMRSIEKQMDYIYELTKITPSESDIDNELRKHNTR